MGPPEGPADQSGDLSVGCHPARRELLHSGEYLIDQPLIHPAPPPAEAAGGRRDLSVASPPRGNAHGPRRKAACSKLPFPMRRTTCFLAKKREKFKKHAKNRAAAKALARNHFNTLQERYTGYPKNLRQSQNKIAEIRPRTATLLSAAQTSMEIMPLIQYAVPRACRQLDLRRLRPAR